MEKMKMNLLLTNLSVFFVWHCYQYCCWYEMMKCNEFLNFFCFCDGISAISEWEMRSELNQMGGGYTICEWNRILKKIMKSHNLEILTIIVEILITNIWVNIMYLDFVFVFIHLKDEKLEKHFSFFIHQTTKN